MNLLLTIGLFILAVNALVVIMACIVLISDWVRRRRLQRSHEQGTDSSR